MRNIILSGLLIVGVMFSILYSSNNHRKIVKSKNLKKSIIVKNLKLSKVENEVSWIVAKKAITNLLKKSKDFHSFEVAREKL